MASPSEAIERIKECLRYRVDGPYIVVENVCHESFMLEAIEVHYYVTVKVEETTMGEAGVSRKEISERLSLSKRLPPGGSVEVYFGPVENIVAVYAIAEYAGGRYKVELRLRKKSEGEEGGGEH